jgi:hypothetical protein
MEVVYLCRRQTARMPNFNHMASQMETPRLAPPDTPFELWRANDLTRPNGQHNQEESNRARVHQSSVFHDTTDTAVYHQMSQKHELRSECQDIAGD